MYAALNSRGLCRAVTKVRSSSMPEGQSWQHWGVQRPQTAEKKWTLTSANQSESSALVANRS